MLLEAVEWGIWLAFPAVGGVCATSSAGYAWCSLRFLDGGLLWSSLLLLSVLSVSVVGGTWAWAGSPDTEECIECRIFADRADNAEWQWFAVSHCVDMMCKYPRHSLISLSSSTRQPIFNYK